MKDISVIDIFESNSELLDEILTSIGLEQLTTTEETPSL